MATIPARHARLLAAVALCAAVPVLSAPAAPAEPASATPADASLGQQLFQTHCARCHGEDAKGTGRAPSLLQRVGGMSEARFTEAVLRRYAWTIAATEAADPQAARQALLDSVVQPRADGHAMPAWQDNPAVRSGIAQLYRYLDTRARQAAR
ncbi:c-type cytochrome [Azohydromonas australica]|uniref:c-type cytochrome n=1 Tax=Azohydromonas australica TaxID=364039 RepID=UPI0004098802|nr:c-type cytochrome [Azohydromonas australica]